MWKEIYITVSIFLHFGKHHENDLFIHIALKGTVMKHICCGKLTLTAVLF